MFLLLSLGSVDSDCEGFVGDLLFLQVVLVEAFEAVEKDVTLLFVFFAFKLLLELFLLFEQVLDGRVFLLGGDQSLHLTAPLLKIRHILL